MNDDAPDLGYRPELGYSTKRPPGWHAGDAKFRALVLAGCAGAFMVFSMEWALPVVAVAIAFSLIDYAVARLNEGELR